MDPLTLSAGLAAVLARLLPFLTGIGDAAETAAAESAGRALGDAVVKRSTALWDRLWSRLRDDVSARQAVIAVAQNPNAERARISLAHAIAPVLARDPELAGEARALVEQLRHPGVANDVEHIAVDGNENVVQVGGTNISIAKARDVDIRNRKHD